MIHPEAEITLVGVGLNPTRTALVELLQRAGADVRATVTATHGGEPLGDIGVRGGRPLRRIEVAGNDVSPLIDELPLVGVLMAVTGGELRDASELRVKESDRIASTVDGLKAIGASVEALPDGWRVEPGPPRQALVATHGDHRIAIAFAIAAVAGLAASVELDDPACVDVSYPGFWDDLDEIAS